MSRCLDHPKELVPGPDGAQTCPACGAAWMMPYEVEAIAAGALEILSIETREKSAAFARPRECPDCHAMLAPLRIGKMEAWVERCASCERYWVERADRRSLEMLAKSAVRQRAFQAMDPAERKELAGGLAAAVAESHPAPRLSPVQVVLAALGIPMLERVEGNRVPWMTWSLALFLVAFYLMGKALPFELGPQALAFHSGDIDSRLLWANFIHFGVLHLVFNLAFLLAFGDAAEQRLHRAWLVIAFVVLGPLTLAFQGLFTGPRVAIGGASGAISVLVGAAIVLQRRARVVMFFLRTIPIRVPVVLFGVFQMVYQGIMAMMNVRGVAWYAHLGGLGLGLWLGFVLRARPAPSG